VAASATAREQRKQLSDQRRKVDFDSYDVTVDELLRRVERNRIDIAPIYQRQFRWLAPRQSRLIESVLLGIPVPPLFMATNRLDDVRSQWEVVDGLQRLLTLVNFAGDQRARDGGLLTGTPLILEEMEKLTCLEGFSFTELPEDIRTGFEDRPVKVIVLNDKSDLEVRFDLFERLNTGGINLTPQEIRECVFRGEFIDLLGRCASTAEFRTVVALPDSRWKDGTPEDFVLRFFAFYETYNEFSHSVKGFLNDFARSGHDNPRIAERQKYFDDTFRFLVKCFPEGLKTRKGQTPVNLFEAVSVGAAFALQNRPNLKPVASTDWVNSPKLRALVTGATNSRPRVRGRIEYCRDRFLGINA